LTLASTRLCAACAVPNTLEAKFCRTCGTQLPPPLPDSGEEAALFVDVVAFEPVDDEAVGERAWSEVNGVAWLFLSLVAVSIAGFIAIKAGAQDAQVDLWLSGVSAVVVLSCVVAARGTIAPLLSTGGGWRGGIAAVAGFTVLMAFGAVYFPAVEALGFPLVRMTDAYMEAGWEPWTAYALVSLTPAVVEELAFRGYMMARLEGLLTQNEVLFVQAALFAVIHFGVVIFPSHFVIGVVFGLLRQRTGSLYPSMAVHAAWNAHVVWAEIGLG
jgi:membrane protease YdiL (CAAX protease family)